MLVFIPESLPGTPGVKAGEQGTETEGKNGCECLANSAEELVFLKPLQLHSLNIPAPVWFLWVWKQSAKA